MDINGDLSHDGTLSFFSNSLHLDTILPSLTKEVEDSCNPHSDSAVLSTDSSKDSQVYIEDPIKLFCSPSQSSNNTEQTVSLSVTSTGTDNAALGEASTDNSSRLLDNSSGQPDNSSGQAEQTHILQLSDGQVLIITGCSDISSDGVIICDVAVSSPSEAEHVGNEISPTHGHEISTSSLLNPSSQNGSANVGDTSQVSFGGSAVNSGGSHKPASALKQLVETPVGDSTKKYCVCHQCSKTFSSKSNLTRHMLTHSERARAEGFKCKECNKTFLQMCDLKRHNLLHEGTFPHKCSYCGKGYVRKSDLKVHERFHLRQKSFSCSVVGCGKTFYQTGDLSRHVRKVHADVLGSVRHSRS